MFFSTLKSQYRQLLRQLDSYIDSHLETALAVTTQLKNILSSPVADIVTAVIPGNLEATVKSQLLAALNTAITALTIAENCKPLTDTNDKLKCFVTQLQQKDPLLQGAVLQKLASLLAANLDGNRLQQHIYDLYTQAKYSLTAK